MKLLVKGGLDLGFNNSQLSEISVYPYVYAQLFINDNPCMEFSSPELRGGYFYPKKPEMCLWGIQTSTIVKHGSMGPVWV